VIDQPSFFPQFDQPVRELSPVAQEITRLDAASLRVLAYLRTHTWASNVELCKPEIGGNRAIGGRLADLRAHGWQFEKEHVKGGTWRYRLIGRK